MKMKTILFLTVASVLGWTGCSNEIDDSSTSDTSLTLVMATEGTQTKAATGTETPATEAEAVVTSVHVAVFDVTEIAASDTANAKRVATFDVGTYESNKRETTVQITGLPAGSSQVKARKYLFYVIANSNVNFSAETKLDTYGKYKSYVVETDPSELIKVGQKTVELYWKSEAELNMPSIAITLIQLTARVDFLGVVEQKDAQTKSGALTTNEKVEYKYRDGIWDESEKAAGKKYILDLYYNEITPPIYNDVPIPGLYYPVFDKVSYTVHYKRLVRCIKTTTSETATNITFTPTSITFYNNTGVNGKSLIAIYNTNTFENILNNSDITLIRPAIKEKSSFYAYETNGKMQLAIKGLWSGGTVGTTEESGYLIQEDGNNNPAWSNVPATGEFVQINGATYLLTLPTLLKGNRYEIRGTAAPSANPTITWEIKKWDSHTVIIPPFQ